jgi:Fe-S cluster biogenesis protein NfuA/nitrite reductase/ring-hydroxylating ferredoxin subunit
VEFDQAVAELETLVQTLEREGDERALMLLELVDAIHRPALRLIVSGQLEHPIARAILAMYDLVPVDDRVQVEEALDEIRPYVESHGGEVELLDVDDGVVHVRMSGACHGCAGSAITLRRGIERSLREHYPAFREVVAHEPDQLLQIEVLRKPVFEAAGSLDDLAPGGMKAIELDGQSVLILNVAGEPYAFRNACPVEPARELPLDGGRLAGQVLVCPWHNCAYDARSGQRVDDRPEEPGLRPVPVALEDGVVKVAVNVA